MKKIVIDCRCLEYNEGISRYLINILNNLLKKDSINKYYLITPEYYDALKLYEHIPNVEIVNFATKHHFIYKFYKIRRFLEKINADIYWSPTQDNLLFKVKNCTMILTMHDIEFEHKKTIHGWQLKLLKNLKLYKKFFSNADFVFYDSNFTKEDVEQTYKISKKNVITYLGASDQFKIIKKSIAKKYVSDKFQVKGDYIFYLDTVRYHNLFDAFKILLGDNPNIYLVCLGGFRSQDIMAYACKIGIEKNIKWINYRVSDIDLNNLYAGSEFFISPSYYEGFGLTPLEALQSGSPIIISDVTCLPEIFQDSALYVDPNISSDIYNKMNSLLYNEKLQIDLLNKSKNIIKKYDWSEVTNKILKIFNNLEKFVISNDEKNKAILNEYIKQLSKYIKFENKTILDIGCGAGAFIKLLSDNSNLKTFGLDHNEDAIKDLKNNKYNVEKFDLDSGEQIPFNKQFDIITMFDVIEHLNSFVSFDKIIDKNLKSGGYLVITTPNSNALQRFINQSGYTGEFDPTHRILYTPYTLDFFLRRRGLVKVFNYTPYIFSFKKNIFNSNLLHGGQIFTLYKKK